MSVTLKIKQDTRPPAKHVLSNNPYLGLLAFTKYGSAATEQVGFRGMSHLCEHLICCAWDDMADYFSSRGITHNAYTDDFKIVCYFTGLDKHISKVMNDVLLRDGDRSIFNYIPSKECFERERNVVLQEYEGYMSDAHAAMCVNLNRKFFNYHGPIGLDSDIRAITYEEFIPFFLQQRNFDQFVYVGSSYLCLDSLRGILDTRSDVCVSLVDIEAHAQQINTDYVHQYFGSKPQETLICDWFELEDVEVWEAKIIQELWNEGDTSAPLMKRLRLDTGLAYGAYLTPPSTIHTALMRYITVNPDNKDKAREIYHATLCDWKTYITPERFKTIVDHAHIQLELAEIENYKRGYISRLASCESRLVTHEKLNNLTYDRIYEIHERNFKQDRLSIAEVGSTLVV